MSEFPVTQEDQAPRPRRSWVGILGVAVSFLGLALAVLSPWILEMRQPPPKPLADEIAEAGAKMLAKLKGRAQAPPPAPPPPKQIDWPTVLTVVASLVGLVGVLLGSVAWIRREDHRLAGTAIAVGLAAVAWQYIAAGIVLAAILVGLFVVLDRLGLI